MSAIKNIRVFFVMSIIIVNIFFIIYLSYRYSPTLNEPAHLVAGLRCWKTGDYGLYRVNPPLVKMVAALPVLMAGYQQDWSDAISASDDRQEFMLGRRFMDVNGERSIFLIMISRFMCIPFSVLGAMVCYLWAKDLYGSNAGLISSSLWVFSPSLMGHGALITADAHAAALGLAAGYAYWKWMRKPAWISAFSGGAILGLSLLTKSTLLIFIPLWTLLWLANLGSRPLRVARRSVIREGSMLFCIFAFCFYVVNLGYGFNGSFAQVSLKEIRSELFKNIFDNEKHVFDWYYLLIKMIRFTSALLPRDYILGIDLQQLDFEVGGIIPSYLMGTFRERGWWYFYLYALMVKTPLGVIGLAVLTGGMRLYSILAKRQRNANWQNDLVLLAPAILLLVVVSSKTGFSKHARYALPCMPFIYVWVGQLAIKPLFRSCSDTVGKCVRDIGKPLNRFSALYSQASIRFWAACLTSWAILSSLLAFPHSLSYFNELAGGVSGGHAWLIGSDIDWGQDLLELKKWQNKSHSSYYLYIAVYCDLDPRKIGLRCAPIMLTDPIAKEIVLKPGWYAVSVSLLEGMPWYSIPMDNGGINFYPLHSLSGFQHLKPVRRVGGSILLYYVEKEARLVSK